MRNIKFLLFLFVLSSCYVEKNLPFRFRSERYYRRLLKKSGEPFVFYTLDSALVLKPYQYRIRVGDVLKFYGIGFPFDFAGRTLSGVGQQALDVPTQVQLELKVNVEGNILLPEIGFVHVEGLTLREAAEKIESLYQRLYKEARVDLQVTSLRVYVYKADNAFVVQLPRERTHLVEVLAMAGGVRQLDKIRFVKIIRGNLQHPTVIWVNLKKIEALEHAALIVHADDLIYIEPRGIQYLLTELRPYLALINLLAIIPGYYFLIQNITRR